ncbi:MAG: hypothetical protein ACOX1Q_01810 [Eubacteriales bacterium]|jgi:hypothetical protein
MSYNVEKPDGFLYGADEPRSESHSSRFNADKKNKSESQNTAKNKATAQNKKKSKAN